MNEESLFEADSGELTILVKAPPVSLQSAAARKEIVTDLIRKDTVRRDFFISGDVQIEVEWMQNEHWRYETHLSPDVDNILKPTIDAICGPSGVLLDDCQVQAVSCRWIDWTRTDQQFEIRIRFFPDEWLHKSGLLFIHMGQSLCFPFNVGIPPIALMVLVTTVVTAFEARDELLRLGAGPELASRVMPIQRFFNRARIATRFPIEDLPAFLRSVREKADIAALAASKREITLYHDMLPKFSEVILMANKRFQTS
jgi:Holliday junction resolvase RusA-like endonuclease